MTYTFAQNSPLHIIRDDTDRIKWYAPERSYMQDGSLLNIEILFYIANVLESFGGEWRLFLIWFKTSNLTKDKDKNSKSTWETKSNHQSCSQKSFVNKDINQLEKCRTQSSAYQPPSEKKKQPVPLFNPKTKQKCKIRGHLTINEAAS